jgi:hypothetical protein
MANGPRQVIVEARPFLASAGEKKVVKIRIIVAEMEKSTQNPVYFAERSN